MISHMLQYNLKCHLFHVKLHLTSSICPWQHQVHRVIGKQEVGGRQRAICVMCSIKSAICATLLLCQMACSRVAKVWGLQRKSPGFRRAFNESFHAFGDIARKSFNVIHHERFKWKPSFSERFAKMVFCSIFFLQIWHFCRQNLQTGALRKRCGFYAVQCPRGSQLLPAWPVLHSMAPFLNCISWPVNKLPVFVFVISALPKKDWNRVTT